MVIRKTRKTGESVPPSVADGAGSALSTVSGPSVPNGKAALQNMTNAQRTMAEQHAMTAALAASIPFSKVKQFDFGLENGHAPLSGAPDDGPADPLVGASTVTESQTSVKIGDGVAEPGNNPTNASLDRVRVDSSDRGLTTNQGVAISDNQNSLKAGLRGPTLLEDFILREKITHFDHERIPERVVHARGSAAHGYHTCRAICGRWQAHPGLCSLLYRGRRARVGRYSA
jgi:catalase